MYGEAYHLTGVNGMKEIVVTCPLGCENAASAIWNLSKTRDQVMSQSEERVEAALAPFDQFKYL